MPKQISQQLAFDMAALIAIAQRTNNDGELNALREYLDANPVTFDENDAQFTKFAVQAEAARILAIISDRVN